MGVVSFAPYAKTFLTLHRKDIARNEKEATWYSIEEYKTMKDEVRSAFFQFKQGETTEAALSAEFLAAHRRRRNNVIRVRLAVFARQSAKKGVGKDISDEIAHACRPLTLSSQYAAILRGFEHRRAAGDTAPLQTLAGTRKRPWETDPNRVYIVSNVCQ